MQCSNLKSSSSVLHDWNAGTLPIISLAAHNNGPPVTDTLLEKYHTDNSVYTVHVTRSTYPHHHVSPACHVWVWPDRCVPRVGVA